MARRVRRSQQPDGAKSAHLRWKDLFLGEKPCERCGGLLTQDQELSVSVERQLPSLRCVQCGEWIDEVILRNRITSRTGHDTPGAGGVRADMNSPRVTRRVSQPEVHNIIRTHAGR